MLDLGIDLNVWPWMWLGIAVFFALVELTVMAGSFVLLPFSVSAFAAALLGFYEVAIELQWLMFIGGGALLWMVLYRYVVKVAGTNQVAPGVGADRLVGLDAIVTVAIDPNDPERRGRVSVLGDIWGALSESGVPLPVGARVQIMSVIGTKVVVQPTTPATHPHPPPSAPPRAAPGETPQQPSTSPPHPSPHQEPT